MLHEDTHHNYLPPYQHTHIQSSFSHAPFHSLSCIVFPTKLSDLNDRLVSMALTNLLDWHKLGLLLGIKKIKLDRIRLDFDKYGSERQRDEMVSFWLRSDRDASWEKLCIALENIDHNTIAEHIRTRYSTK